MTVPNIIHPGEILREEFMEPMRLSAYKLAQEIEVPQTRIGEILKGKRSITADTAIRLGKYFNVSAQFWMNLQSQYDLRMATLKMGERLADLPSLQRPIKKLKVKA